MQKEIPFPFTPQKLDINGHKLAYLDEGRGETVVMLHGNPTWSFFYRNLVTLLQGGYRVIVPDHMGCGNSDKPRDYPYRLENHINNLEKLLENVPGPVSLIVHDWGGAIGFGYAGRHADRINKLIVLNTAAFHSRRIPLRIRLCRMPLLGELLVRGLNGFAYAATFMAVRKKMSPEVKQGFLAPYGNWHDRVAVHRFVQDIPLHANHPSWGTLAAVEKGLELLKDKPMLILWGGGDFCFNDHFYHEWLRRFPAAETKYFPAAGHYLLEDAYEEIAPLIRDFLAEQ